MTGRSLHDALLQVLGDGVIRSRLASHDPHLGTLLGSEEHEVLRRVPGDRLQRMARFLARHYYRERIVRLFRHVRSLVSHTGRDPLAVLTTSAGIELLDRAVLGSFETARALLDLIEGCLTDRDDSITQGHPYWRDLVRYQAAMFLVEATSSTNALATEAPGGGGAPSRSGSVTILDLDWDIPSVVAQFRAGHQAIPMSLRTPTSLLIARSRHHRVTAIRCPDAIRRLVESLDGRMGVDALAEASRLSVPQVERLLDQLKEIGAIC